MNSASIDGYRHGDRFMACNSPAQAVLTLLGLQQYQKQFNPDTGKVEPCGLPLYGKKAAAEKLGAAGYHRQPGTNTWVNGTHSLTVERDYKNIYF